MASSYYHKQSSKPLRYYTFWEVMDRHCAATPDREAVVFYEKEDCVYRATFKQLQDCTWKICAILLQRFSWLQRNDRIAIVGSARPEILLAELAGYRIGNPVMFPSQRIKGGNDLAEAIKVSECKLLFFETSNIEKGVLDMVFNTVSSLKFAVVYGDNASSYVSDHVKMWNDIFGKEVEVTNEYRMAAEQRFKEIEPDSELLAYFTSGTTGKPKAVLWSHFGVVNSQLIFGERHSLDYSTRYLHERPLTTFSGSLTTSRLIGINGSASIVVKYKEIVSTSHSTPLCKLIEKEKATHTILFGYMLHDVVTSPEKIYIWLRNLKVALFGGQVTNQEHAAFLCRLLPNLTLMEAYGSTEMGVLAMNEKDTSIGYIGGPFDHIEIKVIDADGKILQRGETGELCCRMPILFVGYITENGLLPGKDKYGWFHSEDSCIINEKGEIKILGRMSDIIKRAGLIVIPSVVERVLSVHPKIKDVQVVGVPDPRLYQDICACVVPSDPPPSEEELRDWCDTQFEVDPKTGMKLSPRYYLFLEEFPRKLSNKTDRKKLWAMAEQFVS